MSSNRLSNYLVIILRDAAVLIGLMSSTAWAQTVATPGGDFPAARYQGSTEAGVHVFRGIRYAAAPTGDRRWAPPVPPQSNAELLDATRFGSPCPQADSPFGVASKNEDCLFLNVFVPEGTSARDRLPVMVFFYGGAFISGATDLYDAKQLARNGEAIVVTVNYRLGAFGFMASPELSMQHPRRISGNFGILDQELALRWVQQNVASFGGNPREVTVFGESAGAWSICAHLVRPSSEGLFSRVILQSGPCAFPLPALSNSERVGSDITQKAGCTRGTSEETVACLRSLSAEELLRAQPASSELFASPAGLTAFFPTVEGVVVPRQPQEALATGQFLRVPVLSGTNADEGRLFVALAFDLQRDKPLTAEEYPDRIRATAQTLVEQLSGTGSQLTESVLTRQILAEYPLSDYTSAGEALATVIGDGTFSCAAQFSHQLFSLYTPTYAYEFNARSVKLAALPPVSFPYGATHTVELQFLFDLPRAELTAEEQRLAVTMQRYWGQFADTSVPSLGLPAQPTWLPYTVLAPTLQSLEAPMPSIALDFSRRHHCSFWQGILLQTQALTALASAGG